MKKSRYLECLLHQAIRVKGLNPIFYRERFESHLWRLEGPGTDILAIKHFEFDHKILGL